MNPLILASKSPRRAEILNFFTLPFIQKSSAFDEYSIQYTGNPKAYVTAIASGKSEYSSKKSKPSAIIMACDTLVFNHEQPLAKPRNLQESKEMLATLSGKTHSVYTAISLRKGSLHLCGIEMSLVSFHKLNQSMIEKYTQQIFTLDKAGGYAIQGSGSIIVKKIEGCFYNVMGLPIATLSTLLKKIDIDLWDYLKT